MKVLIAEKLSQHRYKTPEGYLICVDSVLARTGKQTYRRNEIFADSEDDRLIEVDRKAEEVFSPETMASFENKPICVEHPDVDVTVDNISEFAVGFVRDIHKGEYEGEPVMLGTLVITDAKTIEEIENGEHTDLSCGYDCDIEDCDSPEQKHIRGNHIALCEHGRAGIAHIVDSVQRKNDEESTYTEVTKNLEKEADKDMKWLDAVVKDSKRITDFDDTPRNVRVVKEFIEKNGNKFSKSKDAYKILDYIKKRTGIANADYGDVLHIIKEYTRAEIADSVKDAEQLYAVEFVYDGDSWSDYLGHVNVRAKSEQDALTKAKRWAVNRYDNACCFKIASTKYTNVETIDVIKDAKRLPAKVKNEIQKFLNHKSTFIKNRDYDVSEFVREFERITKSWMEFPLKITRESIKGWSKTGDGMMRKDYVFSIDGYDEEIIISLYAKPDTYETTEINTYFLDSVADKDYVPFPTKDALNKSNGLEEIKRIINNKNNTFEDTEGMIYLTEKAYNDIKVVIKIYGITQKELEGISKYFFGPGGYNMFR